MKKQLILILICSVAISACNISKKGIQSAGLENKVIGDNSQNSLDWSGIYQGTLPCADCQGIQMQIKLNPDFTYEVASKYVGKSDKIFQSNGSFKWDESGSKIILDETVSGAETNQYLVGENVLIKLDIKGNKVQGGFKKMYNLTKVKYDNVITEKYWKLIELNGKKISKDENQSREIYFILKKEDKRVVGNGGCNTFNGRYELAEGNRLRFSKMASTMMACPDLDAETEFLLVLQTADNYNINKDTLSLNKARMAPMARFECVYFK